MTLALRYWVEDAEERLRIGTGARRPLPAHRVVGEVAVDQMVPEPALAVVPVDEQIFREERPHDHAHAVVHPAGFAQLTHARIHNRIAGLPLLPALQRLRVVGPGKVFELIAVGFIRNRGVVVHHVIRKLAPHQLLQIGLGLLVGIVGVGPVGDSLPHLQRTDFAVVQIRREPRGAVMVGAVALGFVVGNHVVERVLQPLVRRRLARRPCVGQSARPVGAVVVFGMQVQRLY